MTTFLDQYYEAINNRSDSRIRGWFLMDSPWPAINALALYFLMIYYGPKIMEKRKPFKLNGLLVVYNFSMVALNLFIFCEYMTAYTRLNYNLTCVPCREISSPEEMRMVRATWWYFFSKLIEFSDSLFFILRKKNSQLSFLHVYHHSTMFGIYWAIAKWYPSGSPHCITPIVNSFIHVLMYSYYGLSAFGPKIQKYLWWKKYMTVAQLIQFAIILTVSVNSIRTCPFYPELSQLTMSAYAFSYIILFGHFYYIEYHKKQVKRAHDLAQKKSD